METDDILFRVRQSLIQRAQFKLEVTGLRPDRPIEPGRIEDLFVLPAITIRDPTGRAQDRTVDEPVAMRETFLKPRSCHRLAGLREDRLGRVVTERAAEPAGS